VQGRRPSRQNAKNLENISGNAPVFDEMKSNSGSQKCLKDVACEQATAQYLKKEIAEICGRARMRTHPTKER
jgi:hypothetical protein